MPKINSRSKGCRNERSIAKELEIWTGKKFARTPSSGGLQWKNTNAKGDIVCTTEGHYFPFCIEAKAHKEINFVHLLLSNKKVKVLEFWGQCLRDAILADKVPLLFMRFNGMAKNLHLIAFSPDLLKQVYNSQDYQTVMIIKSPEVSLVVVRSDEFFKITNYKKLRKSLKEWKKTKRG